MILYYIAHRPQIGEVLSSTLNNNIVYLLLVNPRLVGLLHITYLAYDEVNLLERQKYVTS